MPVPDTVTKSQLLPTMQSGWEGLWAYLDTLSEAQVTQPKDAGGWSVKDHVIHLAVWEGSMNDVLQKKPRWEYMGVSLPTWESGEINRINDEIYQRNKDLTWAQVRQRFAQEHAQLIRQIEAMSAEDLQRRYADYQPGSSAPDTIGHRLGIASYDHYAKHIPWIQAIVTQYNDTTDELIKNKAELLEAMATGWVDFNAYLDTLTEQQVTQPKDAGGWTVKDHMIHLAVWEGSMNDVLQKKPRWEYMGVSLPTWESGEINRINDEIYQRNKDLTWAQVRQRFAQEHAQLIGQIESMSAEDLQRPYADFQPGSSAPDTIGHRLGIASYDHYAKHIPWIQKIVTSDE